MKPGQTHAPLIERIPATVTRCARSQPELCHRQMFAWLRPGYAPAGPTSGNPGKSIRRFARSSDCCQNWHRSHQWWRQLMRCSPAPPRLSSSRRSSRDHHDRYI